MCTQKEEQKGTKRTILSCSTQKKRMIKTIKKYYRSIKPNNVLMKPRKHKVDPGHKISFYRTLYSNI